jgi:hypothetical protein
MEISARECGQLVRLLGLLQTHLESAIESSLIPGTNEGSPEDQPGITQDRRDWKLAERWVSQLSSKAVSKAKVPLKRAESKRTIEP